SRPSPHFPTRRSSDLDKDPLQRRRHPRTVAHRLYHCRFSPGCRKIKGKDRSGRRRLLQMQHTAVFLDDRKANRKSESAAHRFGRSEEHTSELQSLTTL